MLLLGQRLYGYLTLLIFTFNTVHSSWYHIITSRTSTGGSYDPYYIVVHFWEAVDIVRSKPYFSTIFLLFCAASLDKKNLKAGLVVLFHWWWWIRRTTPSKDFQSTLLNECGTEGFSTLSY